MKNERGKVVSIQELAKAYNSTNYGAYHLMLEQCGVSAELKKILTKKNDEWRFAKNVERQIEMIEMLEKVVDGLSAKITKVDKKYAEAYERYEKARKLSSTAMRIYKRQIANMETARREMETARQCKQNNKEDKQQMEAALENNVKKLKQMQMFTLIHPTATITALDKKRDTVLVCTKFDAIIMQFKKFADEVEDTSADEIEIPYGAREKFATEDAFESAVEYVKLVVRYWAEDKPYNLLYNDEGIKYILEEILK